MHFAKALAPRKTTLSGITTSTRSLLLKARLPMLTTDSGIVIAVILVPEKAF